MNVYAALCFNEVGKMNKLQNFECIFGLFSNVCCVCNILVQFTSKCYTLNQSEKFRGKMSP